MNKPDQDNELSAYDMGARGEALASVEEPEPLWFVEYMKLYPTQENRVGACRIARRLSPDGPLQATILRAVRALKVTDRWKGGFFPSAANFLRDRRWKDAEGLPVPPLPKPKPANPLYMSSVDGTVVRSTQVAMDLAKPKSPEEAKAYAEKAKAGMRQGLIDGWKAAHPGEEPPAALVDDPVGYVTGRIGKMGGKGVSEQDAEAKRQAMLELDAIKHKMHSNREDM